MDRHDPRAPADFRRPLTVQGAQRVKRAARGLVAVEASPRVILTSPARRATQSAKIIAKELSIAGGNVVSSDALAPGGETAALMRELERLSPKSVLLVGHRLELETLVSSLLRCRDENRIRIKRAGAAGLSVAFGATPTAQLMWLFAPKQLRQLGRT